MVEDICERIARYLYESSTPGNAKWEDVSETERKRLIEHAWRFVFKETREFRDPYYELRDAKGEVMLTVGEGSKATYFNLPDAKKAAKGSVNDHNTLINIVEVIERPMTTFYQKVVKTVEEEGVE